MKSYQVKNDSGQIFEVDEDKIAQAEKDGFLPVVSNGEDEYMVPFSKLADAEKDGFRPIHKSFIDEVGGYAQQALGAAAKAADVVTMGYTPQIAGALGAIQGQDYDVARDEYAAGLEKIDKDMPIPSGIGTAIGIGANIALPVAGMSKVVGAVGKTAAPVAYNALQMFAQNPGDTPGQVDPIQFEERGKQLVDQATSPLGFLSLAVPAAQSGLAKAFPSSAERSAFRAYKASPKKAELYSMGGKANFTDKDLGRFALDRGLLDGDQYEMSVKAKEYLKEIGQKIGSFYDQNTAELNKAAEKITGGKLKGYIANSFYPLGDSKTILTNIKRSLGDSVDRKAGVDAVSTYLDQLAGDYPEGIDLAQLHRVKRAVADKVSDFEKAPTDMTGPKRAFRELNSELGAIINEEIAFLEKLLGKEKVRPFKALNEEYSKAAAIAEMAGKSLGREESMAARQRGIINSFVNLLPEANPGYAANVLNATSPRTSNLLTDINSGVDLAQDSQFIPPVPMMSPEQIKQDPNLSPTQKATILNQMFKQDPQQ